jgi:predicted transposase/invertase (TIGR01784 family)
LKIVNNSFIDSALGEGVVDLLYSVNIKGEEGYFWVLCEHQSTQDRFITFRILRYIVQILSDRIEQSPKAALPLIYPLLVYTGKSKYTGPLLLWDLFKEPELAKSFLTGPLQLCATNTIPEELIFKQKFAGLMTYIFQKIHEPDILPYIEKASILMVPISKKDFYYLTDVLKYILSKGETRSQNPEDIVLLIKEILSEEEGVKIMTIAERLIQKGVEQGIERGKMEGIERGKMEGKMEIAKKMLKIGQAIALIAEITGLSVKEIERLSH